MPVGKIRSWIETNMWAILAAGATLWSGYLTGQMTIKNEIADLNRRMAVTEAQVHGRRPAMVCAIRALDQINSSLHLVPPCTIDIPE